MHALTYRRSYAAAPVGVSARHGHAHPEHSAEVKNALGRQRAQARLTVGAVNDRFEQDADHVADAVMRMPEPGVADGVNINNVLTDDRLQRYTIDESCGDTEQFPEETIRQGVARAIEVISASGRRTHCLREEEFQQGVLEILNNTTIECDPDQDARGESGVFSNTISLNPRSVEDGQRNINRLAPVVLHEALHVWEGRQVPFHHTGIVTPCTAACFPDTHGMPSALVDTNAEHCVMPPLVRGTQLTLAGRADVLRGGVGAVMGFRQNLFTALRGHLSGQLGADVGYTHLFSEEAQRRYGSEVLRINPAMFGLSVRPGVMDRRGLVFNLDTGPAIEVSESGTRLGFEFRVGAGYEFDFFYVGAGVGVVVPLSDEAQTLLDASLSAGFSF